MASQFVLLFERKHLLPVLLLATRQPRSAGLVEAPVEPADMALAVIGVFARHRRGAR